jgi:hypothetical protein
MFPPAQDGAALRTNWLLNPAEALEAVGLQQ